MFVWPSLMWENSCPSSQSSSAGDIPFTSAECRLTLFFPMNGRDQGGAAGALEAIGLGDAAVLDRELRAWTAARPPDSGR